MVTRGLSLQQTVIRPAALALASHQQAVKVAVYSLLFINFCAYLVDELSHYLENREQIASFIDALPYFATSLDELGWFGLLAIFEIESYWLRERTTRWMKMGLHLARSVCLVLIANTFVIYFEAIFSIFDVTALPGTHDLCASTAKGMGFLDNQVVLPITPDNCASLIRAWPLYLLNDGQIITDLDGYQTAMLQAWADVLESGAWILLSLCLTLIVILQQQPASSSQPVVHLRVACRGCYGIILLCALSWGWHGHWLYTWDSCLWMGGFAAIELNLADWREGTENS